ncbi:MAG: hypothetical protein IJZ53_09825 [Tyzzerella sp.]|nr:hypothetical protein [Tyzzerella sp.]
MIDVTKYGAVGDGVTDCSPAIKKALENEKELHFPAGTYVITEELLIPSNRHIYLDKDAVIFAADHCFDKEGVRAVITNADHVNGNENIIIEGGKVDANNVHNGRAHWKYGPNWGLTFCFMRVKNLTVKNLISHNAESYNFRLNRVEDFLIEGITFTATHFKKCQDGVHLEGFCHRGVIRDIRGEYGCTNDDIIAFTADEAVDAYAHCMGVEDGPISDILVENVYAENCWSAVRLLSVEQEISNVTIRNLSAGVRCHGLNLDGSRHTADPVFKEENYPNGIGKLKNIVFENVTLWRADKTWKEEVLEKQGNCSLTVESFPIRLDSPHFNIWETKGDIIIKNLRREREKDCNSSSKFLRFKHLHNTAVTINGETLTMQGEERYIDGDKFDITIRSY